MQDQVTTINLGVRCTPHSPVPASPAGCTFCFPLENAHPLSILLTISKARCSTFDITKDRHCSLVNCCFFCFFLDQDEP